MIAIPRHVTPWRRRRRCAVSDMETDKKMDQMIADLVARKEKVEASLRERQRQNHWQEAISQMIQSKE